MGVSWVVRSNETVRSIEASLEKAGAYKKDSFKVDCTAFRPTSSVQGQINNFYLLHHSNFPESSFTYGEPPPNGISPRAVSDQGFDLILHKFTSGLSQDAATSFEITGSEYILRDFRIRCGNAVMGKTTNKGVIVEFEFAACDVVFQCFKLMQELVTMFFPEAAKAVPPPLVRQHSVYENYLASDTLEQYLKIFIELRIFTMTSSTVTCALMFSSELLLALHGHFGNGSSFDVEPRVVEVPLAIGQQLYELWQTQHQQPTEEPAVDAFNAECASAEVADILEGLSSGPSDEERHNWGVEMANRFIEHKVVEPVKSKKPRKKDMTVHDEDKAKVAQLHEIFAEQFTLKDVKRAFEERGDFELTLDFLSDASAVGDVFDKRPSTPVSVIARGSSPSFIARSNSLSGRSTSTESSGRSSRQNDRLAVVDAAKYREQAAHYRQCAASLSNRQDLRFGQYCQLSKEATRKHDALQFGENERIAESVSDSLDLHGFEVQRAIDILARTVEYKRARTPRQIYLEVITGRGNRNANNKAPLRTAVLQWLRQKGYSYHHDERNDGAVKVNLRSTINTSGT